MYKRRRVEACARVRVEWAGRTVDATGVSAGTRGHGHLEAPVRLKARARRVMRSTRAHAREAGPPHPRFAEGRVFF